MSDEMIASASAAAVFQYHKALVEKHGVGTTGALGWMQTEGQQARFAMLSRIGDMNGCLILDAGCGHADLFSFLKVHYSAITYYGCEQMPELLNVAARRYKGEKNIALRLGNFFEEEFPVADYVLASGSLNYRHEEKDFIYKAISTLYAKCRLALGFNLLSGGIEAGTLLVSYNVADIIGFCNRLSDKIALHEGYWQDDFTVFIYR